MKKWLPYILGLIGFVVLAILVMTGSSPKRTRKMDERISLKQKDKIPYGMAAARELLPGLYPHAQVYIDVESPGMWEKINFVDHNQAVILVSEKFNADEYEIDRLLKFSEKGNYVFIIAKTFSDDAQNTFGLSSSSGFDDIFQGLGDDSLAVRLEKPFFQSAELFVYPGFKHEGAFYTLDSLRTTVLGRNETGSPNFIRFSRGNGNIFIHCAPLAFSNYFILHKNNIRYFESALSVIPPEVKKVVWNEYYLNKKAPRSEGEPDWLRILLRYPAFKWGLLTIAFALVLYVLLGSRRRQRMIPPYPKPKNESLDFIKTMGRLYHERRDHFDIARKMGVYFLEHIRTVYKLPTHTTDQNFIQALHFKSGYPEQELAYIVSFINGLDAQPAVNEAQLANFHRQLELFYQNT